MKQNNPPVDERSCGDLVQSGNLTKEMDRIDDTANASHELKSRFRQNNPPVEEKIIVELCSGSGNWSRPWEEAGYKVYRFDIMNGHDVRLLERMKEKIYGVLAGPPCDHFAGSGARWWEGKGESALLEGLAVADSCMRFILVHKPKFWCLENPVGRLSKYYGKPVMTFQPWEYGDPYQKRTCLWGDFNIPVKTPVVPTDGQKIWKMAPGPERKAKRSITPSGFARAFYEANK